MSFRLSIISSLLIHLFLLLVFSTDLNKFFYKKHIDNTISHINIDIVNISDVDSQVNNSKKQIKKTTVNKKNIKKNVKKNKNPVTKKKSANLAKKKTSNIQKVNNKKSKSVIKQSKTKNTPVKKQEKKIDPKNDVKKIVKKSNDKNEKTKDEELKSLLKDLIKNEEQEKNNQTKNKQDDKKTETNDIIQEKKNSKFSITEISLIKETVKKHWRVPVNINNNGKIDVTLNISLDRDGNVQNAKIKEFRCTENSGNMCNIIKLSVLRAMSSMKKIEGLPIERYEIWKNFNLYFDLNELF